SSILRDARICKQDIQSPFFGLDLFEQAIKMGEVGHVALNADGFVFKFLYRCIQFMLTASGNENISAFADEPFCRCKTDAARATVNECDFSFELAHDFSSLAFGPFLRAANS